MIHFFCLLLLLIPTLTRAESTISCHCFQDRTFNHRDTMAADPYFLATTQNSFLAVIYDINKGQLVKAKMSGVNGSYLWIAYDLAARSGQNLQQISALHSNQNDWIATFKALNLTPDQLGKSYWNAGKNPEQLADYIVDQHMIKFFAVKIAEIDYWRSKGMNRKELILVNMLEGAPLDLYNQVNSRTKSWGQLLDEQGFKTGKAITEELKIRVRSSPS